MKSAYELLLQKELDLAKVKKEVEALRVVGPLLQDEEDRTPVLHPEADLQ